MNQPTPVLSPYEAKLRDHVAALDAALFALEYGQIESIDQPFWTNQYEAVVVNEAIELFALLDSAPANPPPLVEGLTKILTHTITPDYPRPTPTPAELRQSLRHAIAPNMEPRLWRRKKNNHHAGEADKITRELDKRLVAPYISYLSSLGDELFPDELNAAHNAVVEALSTLDELHDMALRGQMSSLDLDRQLVRAVYAWDWWQQIRRAMRVARSALPRVEDKLIAAHDELRSIFAPPAWLGIDGESAHVAVFRRLEGLTAKIDEVWKEALDDYFYEDTLVGHDRLHPVTFAKAWHHVAAHLQEVDDQYAEILNYFLLAERFVAMRRFWPHRLGLALSQQVSEEEADLAVLAAFSDTERCWKLVIGLHAKLSVAETPNGAHLAAIEVRWYELGDIAAKHHLGTRQPPHQPRDWGITEAAAAADWLDFLRLRLAGAAQVPSDSLSKPKGEDWMELISASDSSERSFRVYVHPGDGRATARAIAEEANRSISAQVNGHLENLLPGAKFTSGLDRRPTDHGSPKSIKDRVRVDLDNRTVAIDGQTPAAVSEEGARFMLMLVEANGGWVSSTELKCSKQSQERFDRIKSSLPEAIGALVKAKRGTGFRIEMPPEE